MSQPRVVMAVAASFAMALGLASCSSGGSAASTTTRPSSSSTTTTTTSSTTTTTSSSPTTTTTTRPSPARSKAEIASAYDILFNLANPALAPKLSAVQDGQQLKQAMEKALHSPLAKLAGGAKVNAVSLKSGGACSQETLSSPCAAVVYDVLSPKGKVVLANAKGFAVYVAPRWLVSKTTICALLTIDNGGKAPPGC